MAASDMSVRIPKDVPPSRKWASSGKKTSDDGVREPKIAKVTMLYGENEIYTKAIHSHTKHNERWGYEMYVLRENPLGGRGFWNKPSYLLSLIVAELGKKEEDRIDWFMWVDADLILINPAIPLSIFLPPTNMTDGPSFLGNKDQNGLNTGTFFLRVCEWSVRMLAAALAMPMYRPDLDLTNSLDQVAMAMVFNQSSAPPGLVAEATEIGWDGTGGTEEQRAALMPGGSNGEVLYQPRVWYNTYEWHHAYEGKPGNLLVHFPGLEEARWEHMEKWLGELADNSREWEIALDKTMYPAEVKEYWTVVAKSRDTLERGWVALDGLDEPRVEDASDETRRRFRKTKASLETAVNSLAWSLWHEADQPAELREKEEVVRFRMREVGVPSEKSKDGEKSKFGEKEDAV